jgi:RNAse (barnase) inhibitor barstar
MGMLIVAIPVEKIRDWPTFHDVFQQTLGFPQFYGRNMDAWIDCMTSVDSPEDGLSAVTVEPNQILVLKIEDPFEFKKRCPEQFDAIMEGSAFVNFRRTEIGKAPVLALLLNGRYEPRTS